ncbi:MAG: hypothetical protein WC215_04095 [Bacilli bacterium]|nr:hypothetical protein [Bacilli bacterium]
MKKLNVIFVTAITAMVCISLGKMIIDKGNNGLGVKAEPLLYEIRLDSTNRKSGLPLTAGDTAISGFYIPSRSVEWQHYGPVYAPENGHIGYDFHKQFGWCDFISYRINNSYEGIKGIQTLTIDYEIIGTVVSASMYYGSVWAPASVPFEGVDSLNFNSSTSPVVLDMDDLSEYQDNFYLRFRLYANSIGAKFIIKSLVATYTCAY